ncbi:hypothetical protein F4778DRAFT_784027 [Xylariomycetidae sp. FL2044]|nr:hypothetical protein F4778DRAFT_784027 [Xylariomycetidae sp. FL2044]
MHPAPSLAESFPKDSNRGEERPQHVAHQLDHDHQHIHPRHSPPERHLSPPLRKDTASSTSTTASDATIVTNASSDTNATAFSVESSQSIFSIKDGSEISHNRRASRRRTGPLSAQQREKAALIRKLGACVDCRRRRVACHPMHHNMSWEDAVRKYRSTSPLQELAPIAGRPISPAPSHVRPPYAQDHQEMDIDTSPTTPSTQTTPGRPVLSDARIRTPLPSGPRLEKLISMAPLPPAPTPYHPLPNAEAVKRHLEGTASRILSSPHRSRYTNACALLIYWQEDDDQGVVKAVDDLGRVLEQEYNFSSEVFKIPPVSDACNSWRSLSRIIIEFTERHDTPEVLKLVYYNGLTHLDENREMVLASSRNPSRASTIRWSGIQQHLEEACSDTLIIMDAAYYPSSRMIRQRGVLELIAASASGEYFDILGRSSFTKTLVDQLRTRATQRLPNDLSAAELHSKLLSIYPKIFQDKALEKEAITTSLPSPLHMLMSGNSKLPSITLSRPQHPRQQPRPLFSSSNSPEIAHGPQLNLTMRLTEETLNLESWTDWLRLMPEGIKELRVEGPYTTTFR